MKKFLINGFIFFLIFSLLNIPFYAIVDKVYWRYYKNVKTDFNKFIFADSHGIRLRAEMHGFFNFSAGSDNYADMLRKLNYLRRKTQVDTVIISAEDHTLSNYREILNNKDRSAHYTNHRDYDNIYQYWKEKYIKNYYVLLNSKQRDIVYTYLKKNLFGKKVSENEIKKEWLDYSEEERILKATSRAKTQFNKYKKSEVVEKSLRNLIETCLENNIYIVGVKFPLTKLYMEIINDQSFYADSVFLEYNIPVYDFTKLYVDRDDYFVDQDHLNREGSKEFTEILIHTIRKK